MREPTIPVNELCTSDSGSLINGVKAWRRSASDLRRSREGSFVPASLINDPQHWRKRADEARHVADDMKDEISKQMTLQIADDYEHLAKRPEEGAKHYPSGPTNPYGIRAWKCRITAASVLGIEIANEVPQSGTRLDPIILGILVSSLHAMEL